MKNPLVYYLTVYWFPKLDVRWVKKIVYWFIMSKKAAKYIQTHTLEWQYVGVIGMVE